MICAMVILCAMVSNISIAHGQIADKSNPSPLKFPIPKGISNQLFYLQRDPNTNTFICELNVDKNGDVDRKEPVLIYWVRYNIDGKKADLSYVQRKFAYGIQTKELGKDHFELRFVSHKELALYLVKDNNNKFHVYTTVNKKKMRLERIFVRIEGGSFWLPNVKYVELRGINPETNTVVAERIVV
ncbi:DUF4833 domain-containing protein [Pedobacter psychroterrae]|uniref:DUF4833 domain-containing protein n=2 Tax=Pedobacter psychroterrae TaxID=2530453 RepID=A0A4R0NLT9_9SPHI|nr:DUF4833 domain-containing protein [Pedobacter psychroterrae]